MMLQQLDLVSSSRYLSVNVSHSQHKVPSLRWDLFIATLKYRDIPW